MSEANRPAGAPGVEQKPEQMILLQGGFLEKPDLATCWMWLHPSYLDRDLWQNCMVAAYGAEVEDPIGVAQKMYAARGGKLAPPHLNRRRSGRKAVNK